MSNLLCFLGVSNNTNLTTILEKLDAKLCNLYKLNPGSCARQLLGLPATTDIVFVIGKLLDYICTVQDVKVKVSATDLAGGYLADKVEVGDCLVKTITQDLLGNQKLNISIDFNCLKTKIPICIEVNCTECNTSCVPSWVNKLPVEYQCASNGANSVNIQQRQQDGCGNERWNNIETITWAGVSTVCNGTTSTITLGTDTLRPVQYAINQFPYTFQTSPIFSGLTPNTLYPFKARLTEFGCMFDGFATSASCQSGCIYTYTRTQNFTRNNCGVGCTGSVVSFNKNYCSSISVSDAQAIANNDATYTVQGQEYANANGVCDCACSCVAVSNGTINGSTQFNVGVSQSYSISGLTGTAPFSYTWSVSPSVGATITNANSAAPSIVFTNPSNYIIACVVQNCANTTCVGTHTLAKNITVNSVPCTAPTNVIANSNSPVTIGGTINLTSSSTGGTSYSWTGPSGFVSNLQNPTIPNSTLNMSGTYTVTVNSTGNCTATASTTVIVNNIPCTVPTAIITVTNPTCSGNTVNTNGKLTLTLHTNATKYALDIVTPYSSATVIPVGSADIVTGINTTNTYTVRIFNGSDACYQDYTHTITAPTCGNATCTTYNIQGTSTGATYSYDNCTTLNTVNGTLNSGQSVQVCAETGTVNGTNVTVTSLSPCQPSCTFPTNLSLVKSAQDASTVTIQVLAVNGATFKKCLGTVFSCGNSNCSTGDGNVNGTFVINLATGSSATYTVRVYNASGCGCYTDITRTIVNNFPTTCTGIQGCTIN
jgi:hypothetical protein